MPYTDFSARVTVSKVYFFNHTWITGKKRLKPMYQEKLYITLFSIKDHFKYKTLLENMKIFLYSVSLLTTLSCIGWSIDKVNLERSSKRARQTHEYTITREIEDLNKKRAENLEISITQVISPLQKIEKIIYDKAIEYSKNKNISDAADLGGTQSVIINLINNCEVIIRNLKSNKNEDSQLSISMAILSSGFFKEQLDKLIETLSRKKNLPDLNLQGLKSISEKISLITNELPNFELKQ